MKKAASDEQAAGSSGLTSSRGAVASADDARPSGPVPARGLELVAFDVEGTPQGEPRARFGKNVYPDRRAHPWKHDVRAACKAALLRSGARGLHPLGTALAVEMVFRFPRPKSHYRTGRFAGELKPNAPTFHTAKPDADNCAKAVLDALGRFDQCPNLLWCDDAQIAWAPPLKLYADPEQEPGASVVIYPLERKHVTAPTLIEIGALTIGERLEIARRRAELTQPEAAGVFGVAVSTYRNWELDRIDGPELTGLRELADFEQCLILRRRSEMTLQDIADETGLSRHWLSRAERGLVRSVDALVQWWIRTELERA